MATGLVEHFTEQQRDPLQMRRETFVLRRRQRGK
jgi:hypothetical protein